jgi:acetyl-CoA carboxylase biotin carboxyl carrier protein
MIFKDGISIFKNEKLQFPDNNQTKQAVEARMNQIFAFGVASGVLRRHRRSALLVFRPTLQLRCQINSNLEKTLDLKEIRQIIEMMKRHDLSLFHLEKDGTKVKLKKGVDFETLVKAVSSQGGSGGYAPAPHAPTPIRYDSLLPASASGDDADDVMAAPAATSGPSGPTMNSPMVGTFYRSPSPNDPPFVKDGERVAEGQVICIIEAMKVMNEIKSELSGTVVRCLVNDGTPVQFGQAMFEIRPG